MKHAIILAAILGIGAHIAVRAQQPQHATPNAPGVAQAAGLAQGEVRRIDKDAKKLTIRHGPLKSLDMPAMTMVFQVKDPAMLDQVRVGDKIEFIADKVGGAFTVMQIEVAK